MTKQHRKQIPFKKFCLLFLLFGTIFACQTPEDLIEEEQTKNIKVSILRKTEIENRKFLLTKLNKISQELTNAKVVYNTMYNFSIDTDLCKMIESNGITTYTFAVKREQPNGLFENLILKEMPNGTFSSKLIQYNISETEKEQILNGIDVDLTNRINTITIDDQNFTNNLTSKIYYNPNACYDVNIVTVPGQTCPEGHSYGQTCYYAIPGSSYYNPSLAPTHSTTQLVYTEIDCEIGGGDSNPPDSEDGSSGGSTSPTGGGGDVEAGSSPCDQLKKHLSTTSGIKLKSPEIYDYLKGKLIEPKEFGFYFKKENRTYTAYESYNATNDKITVKIGENYFCSIHTHPYPTANPMFTWEDLYSLQQYFQNVNIELEQEVTIFLVVKDNYGVNQLYALKIDDYTTLSDFILNDIDNTVTSQDLTGLTTDEERLRKILDLMNAKQHKYNLSNPNMNQEIPFLNYFAGCGASLYKANSTLTNWDKLTLSNNTTNPITKTPCN